MNSRLADNTTGEHGVFEFDDLGLDVRIVIDPSDELQIHAQCLTYLVGCANAMRSDEGLGPLAGYAQAWTREFNADGDEISGILAATELLEAIHTITGTVPAPEEYLPESY